MWLYEGFLLGDLAHEIIIRLNNIIVKIELCLETQMPSILER